MPIFFMQKDSPNVTYFIMHGLLLHMLWPKLSIEMLYHHRYSKREKRADTLHAKYNFPDNWNVTNTKSIGQTKSQVFAIWTKPMYCTIIT